MAARMITLVIGRFELSWVNHHKLANLGTRQQVNRWTASAAASHNANNRVVKSLRSICTEKLCESFLSCSVCFGFVICDKEVGFFPCLFAEQSFAADQTVFYRQPVSSVEYTTTERQFTVGISSDNEAGIRASVSEPLELLGKVAVHVIVRPTWEWCAVLRVGVNHTDT